MQDIDQQLKNLDPKHFPELVKQYQANPGWIRENVERLRKKEPDLQLPSLLANWESDLQSLSNDQSGEL